MTWLEGGGAGGGGGGSVEGSCDLHLGVLSPDDLDRCFDLAVIGWLWLSMSVLVLGLAYSTGAIELPGLEHLQSVEKSLVDLNLVLWGVFVPISMLLGSRALSQGKMWGWSALVVSSTCGGLAWFGYVLWLGCWAAGQYYSDLRRTLGNLDSGFPMSVAPVLMVGALVTLAVLRLAKWLWSSRVRPRAGSAGTRQPSIDQAARI